MMEALACHPLGKSSARLNSRNRSNFRPDTIKVRMQLSRRARAPGVRSNPCLRLAQIVALILTRLPIGEEARLYHNRK
jgi:hypothetical protein